MIVEEWIGTTRPGADWQSWEKEFHQGMQRLGIPFRCFIEESGLINRVHTYVEFQSLAEREKFYSKLPSDLQAVAERTSQFWDTATLEHHYYNVFI